MAYAVNDAVLQVLSRLGEVDDSPVAELPDGSSSTPTITSAAQIVTFLTEGSRELVRQGILELWGDGTYTVPIATKRALYTSFTMTTTGQVFWRPKAGSWNTDPIQVCDRRWYEIHNPTIEGDPTAAPERVYPDIGGVLLAPRPSTAQVLRLSGLVLPRDQVAGQNFYDVPDHLVPGVVIYAALRVLGKVGGKSADARALYDDLVAQWAAFAGPSAPVPGG